MSDNMKRQFDLTDKQTLINLVIFYLFYSALIITEKQIIRKGYLGFQLPFEVDVLKAIIGLIAGSVLVLIVSAFFRPSSRILRVILIASFFLGAISINYFLFRFYYPPFISLPEANLDSLGSARWMNSFPYEMYSGVYKKYNLDTINLNSDINEYPELERLERFGNTILADEAIPKLLNQYQFETLESELGEAYQSGSSEYISYRLYDIEDGEELALTRYKDILLFVPLYTIQQ